MNNKVNLKYYTVSQVKSWLFDNCVVEGLSDSVIAKTRAYSIVHNPYVSDSSPIISALFDDGHLAAYTAAFPDVLQRPEGKLCWWFTTLSCEKQYEGKGYGIAVVGQLCELNGIETAFDLAGAKETVEIFNFLGLSLRYFPWYVLSKKAYVQHSLKGAMVRVKYNIANGLKNRKGLFSLRKTIDGSDYKIEYTKFLDKETFSFIESNSENDVFLRSREMLNWILSYPFMNPSPLYGRVPEDLAFSSTIETYSTYAVRVVVEGKIVAFYILRQSSWHLSVKYLYYDVNFKDIAFLSIAEHALCFKNKKLTTCDKELASFLLNHCLYPKLDTFNLSFSHPATFEASKCIQAGDGDIFV